MAKGSLRVNGIIVDDDGEIKASTGDAIVIREDDGSSVITVDTGGRTLIGSSFTADAIATITAGLQVEGIAANSSSMSIFKNSNDTAPPYLILGKSRSGAVGGDTIVADNDELGRILFCAADGVDRASIGASIDSLVGGTPGANDTPGELLFKTTADGAQIPTERMRIMSTGNVGIGTTLGTRLVDLYQDTGGADIPLLLVRNTDSQVNFLQGVHALFPNNQGDGSTERTSIGLAVGSAFTNGNSGYIGFVSNNSDNAANRLTFGLHSADNLMCIRNDGKVGIGTTAPTTRLNVASADPVISIGTGTAKSWFTSSYDLGVLQIGNSSFYAKAASGAGNFLQIAQNWYMATDSNHKYFDTDEASRITMSNGEIIFANAASGTADSTISWSEGMRIKVDGKVGIGTTAPSSTTGVHFTHATEAKTHGLAIYNYVNANNGIAPIWFGITDVTAHRYKAGIGLKRSNSYGLGDLVFTVDSNADDADVTFANDEKMRITSAGNVGIGNSNPGDFDGANAQRLVVGDGTGHDGMTIFSSATDSGTIAFGDSASGAAAYSGRISYAHDTNALSFYTGGNTFAMTILSNQKVGIGTTAPTKSLEVHSTTSGTALFEVRSSATPSGTATSYGGTLYLGLSQYSNTGSGGNPNYADDVLGNILFSGQGTDYAYHGGEIKVVATVDGGDRAAQAADMIFSTYPVSGTSPVERMKINSSGAIQFKAASSTTGEQVQKLEWWNENNAGIMAKISCIREAASNAPGAIAFYTSGNVDSTSNNHEGAWAERMRISSSGVLGMNGQQFRVQQLVGGSITNSTWDAMLLDNNGMYEIIYTAQSYNEGTATTGWRYVRWHAYDGSGGGGENAGANWHIAQVEATGTGESSHTPSWSVPGNYARITYGNGYMSYRMLTIRLMAGGQTFSLTTS